MSYEGSETVLGAVVHLSQPDEGDNVWEATQKDVLRSLPPNVGNRQEINWGFGPVTVTGYLDIDTFEIGVSVSVVGISLGTIYGNLKDGVVLKVDIFVAKGEIRFYLKNGNELWVGLDLKITFDGSFQGDYKILTF